MEHPELSNRFFHEQFQEETEAIGMFTSAVENIIEDAYDNGEVVAEWQMTLQGMRQVAATRYWYLPPEEEPADYWCLQLLDLEPEISEPDKRIIVVRNEVLLAEDKRALMYPVEFIEAAHGIVFSGTLSDMSFFTRMAPEAITEWSEYLLETFTLKVPMPDGIRIEVAS